MSMATSGDHSDWQPQLTINCPLPAARPTHLQQVHARGGPARQLAHEWRTDLLGPLTHGQQPCCVISTKDGGSHCNQDVWSCVACSPSHTCKRCEQEEEAPGKGALIPCARCPIAYHLGCMPEAVLASKRKRVWLAGSGMQHAAAAQSWLLPDGLVSLSIP